MSDADGKPSSWWSGLAGKLRKASFPNVETPMRPADLSKVARAIYAVGDIHGRLDLLLKLEAAIRDDLSARKPTSALLIFLGDYIDRGPASCGVIEHLITRPKICDEDVYLRGNHEQVLLDFMTSSDILDSWSQFGGLETLFSYGLRPRLPLTAETREELKTLFAAALPASHLAFLQRWCQVPARRSQVVCRPKRSADGQGGHREQGQTPMPTPWRHNHATF